MTGRIYLGATEYSVGERDGFVTIIIKRDGDTSGAVTATYATNAGTATAGSDYTTKSGTVVIPAGQNSVSVQIPILNDSLSEPTERFSFTLSAVSSGEPHFPRTANISILDDENPVDPPANPPQTTPFTVSRVNVVTGLNDPLQIQWVNNTTALVSEQGGVIKVVDMATGTVKSTLLDISAKVNSDADRGLLDIELHPDLANNPYLYAYYVVDPPDAGASGNAGRDGLGNRYAHLVRYTLNLDGPTPTIVAGSEKIMLGAGGRSLADISGGGQLDYTDPVHRNARASDVDANGNYKQDYIKVDSRSHAGGAIEFGPDGALYVATGDGTSYNYADPRTVSVQNVNSLSGKILRIDPMTGQGLADNPYATAGNLDANASKVWQMGLRNPYTMAFSQDGKLMISETGWYSWEEINSGGKGANFGWPYFEGGDTGEMVRTPEYQNLPSAAAFYAAVANGSIVVTAPFRAFSHVAADPGHQMSAIIGGNFVYSGDKYPGVFKDDYFFADVIDGDIFAVDVNDRTQLQYVATVGQYASLSFSQGPDGYVYFADASQYGNGKIVRLMITDPNGTVNRNPVVNTALSDANGTQGVAINYTVPANAFTDPDGDVLTLVATLAGGAQLPAWLTFNAATRTFTGTPPAGATGPIDITVTALDAKGGYVSDIFRLTISAAQATNAAPYVAGAIAHQNATTGTAFTHTLAAGTFVDPNGDALTLTATLANGQPLPSWLSFNAVTRTFSGTPPTGNTDTLLIAVTATDPSGAKAADVFSLTVATFNPAPILVDPLANQEGEAGTALSFTLPAGTFTDNGALTLSAKLGNGAALPAWLVFNAATGTFTGTPPANFDGRVVITVTATDAQGLTASDSFVLDIDPPAPNAPPTVANAIADQTTAEEANFTFTVPANTFADVNGDPLTLTTTLAGGAALPSWLTFNAATRTFSGRPDDAQVGKVTVVVTANDGKGGTVSDTFDITITPVNDAPVVAAPIADQTAREGTAFTFQVPAGAFTDVDGDTLTYTATLSNGAALPSWLAFDAATRTFSGTPPAGSADLVVRVTANDGKGGTVSDDFDVATPTAVNVAPIVAVAIPDQTTAEEIDFSYTIPPVTFSDANGDMLTYSALRENGMPLPAWLKFDAATRTFSGRPDDADVGTVSVRVVANDGRGGVVSDVFQIRVNPVNDMPVVAVAFPDQTITEGTAFTFTVPQSTFTDADLNSTLTVTATQSNGAALPGWLVFNAETWTFTGTAPAGSPDLVISLVVNDGNGGTVTDTFNLVTSGVANLAPIVANPIVNQTTAEEAAFIFTLPANTFTDANNDTLTYSARLAGGAALPAWLSFDAATRTFSGRPDDAQVGTVSVEVTVSDGRGGTTSDAFDIVITPVNDAPKVLSPIADQSATEGREYSFVVPAGAFGDVDGDTLTFTASLDNGAPLPTWLTFNAASRLFSGIPPAGASDLTVRVTASDGKGGTVSDSFVLTTPAGANRAPTVQTPILDVTGTEQVAFSFKLPAGIFADADGDTLTKTFTLENGQPLPAWLTYNAATETFTGMPDDQQVGTISIKVTASDGKGGTVSDTFNLTIAGVNDAPVVANPIADTTATTGTAFNFVVPANAFADVDSPTLTYSATLANGSALPSWLTFNAATRTFSGTPADANAGAVSVRVTATDNAGAKATDDFNITVSRPTTAETLYQNTSSNQTIDAGDGRDVFVFNTTSNGYSWGPTQDGKGIVVWKGGSFDILFNFEAIRFTNKSIEVSSILGSGSPDVLDDPDAVQHLTGKSTADRFIIDAVSTDYRWGATQDGKGVVVWRTTGDDTYDILTGFETLVFDDRTVDISGIGTV